MAENILKKGYLGVSDLIEPIDEYIDPIEPIIKAITKDLAVQFDGKVTRAVKEVGVVVDKDRLVQALTDANKFYEEGYLAGCNSVHRHGHWIEGWDTYCSVCGIDNDVYDVKRFKYCPNCGSRMDGKDGADDGT